jgi:hypothetical protein
MTATWIEGEVRYVDMGSTVAAFRGGDPTHDEDFGLGERADDRELLGVIHRVKLADGGGWWGWTLQYGPNHAPLERYRKSDAVDELRLLVADSGGAR